MKQDVIREDLKNYLKENGIKSKFITQKIWYFSKYDKLLCQ